MNHEFFRRNTHNLNSIETHTYSDTDFSQVTIGLATKSFRFFYDFQNKFIITNNKHESIMY